MDRLYTPWRSAYAQSIKSKGETTSKSDCVFCEQLAENNDEKYFIFRRFTHHFIMLNHFPYNTGHLLILPLEHIAQLGDLSKDARAELIELTAACSTIMLKELNADGINVGINLGRAAGAGIPAHLHEHILPRWFGDTNFMPVLTDTKVLSFSLTELFAKINPHIQAI